MNSPAVPPQLHLEIVGDRIRREFQLDIDISQVRVSYREAITRSVQHTSQYEGQLGGKVQRAQVTFALGIVADRAGLPTLQHVNNLFSTFSRLPEPNETDAIDFSPETPPEIATALRAGIESGLSRGALLGFPVTGARVTVVDWQLGQGSQPPALSACAAQCMKKALAEAGPQLLEPVMALEVTVDDAHVGAVLNDLSAQRRAAIGDVEMDGAARTVHAEGTQCLAVLG